MQSLSKKPNFQQVEYFPWKRRVIPHSLPCLLTSPKISLCRTLLLYRHQTPSYHQDPWGWISSHKIRNVREITHKIHVLFLLRGRASTPSLQLTSYKSSPANERLHWSFAAEPRSDRCHPTNAHIQDGKPSNATKPICPVEGSKSQSIQQVPGLHLDRLSSRSRCCCKNFPLFRPSSTFVVLISVTLGALVRLVRVLHDSLMLCSCQYR